MLEVTPPEIHRKCPACASNDMPARALSRAPSYNECHYWRCHACGIIFLHPLPCTEENLAFEGDESAQTLAAADDARLPLLRRRVALLGVPPAGSRSLLDIGCSTGRVMGLAREAGWHVTGIEMSAALADEARRYLSSAQSNPAKPDIPDPKIITGDIMLLDTSGFPRFDAIISLDVIEHVLDPAAFLARCNDLLNPGGHLILHTPNAQSLRARLHRGRWNMLIPEYHFTLFTAGALHNMLQEHGFADIRIKTTSGTGHERGIMAYVAGLKESILASARLGNALLAVAQR